MKDIWYGRNKTGYSNRGQLQSDEVRDSFIFFSPFFFFFTRFDKYEYANIFSHNELSHLQKFSDSAIVNCVMRGGDALHRDTTESF